MVSASVNMAFCGQSFCRRGQLNFVRATRDHAVTWLDTGAHANETRISRGDVDEAPGEPLTGNLHEHVRPAGFHQHCLLRHDGDSLRSARVQDGGAGLADKQLAVSVLHLDLKGSARVFGSITPASCT